LTEALNGQKSRKLARQEIGIAEDETVLLVYGALTLRKGIDALLRATQESNLPKELVILFAGVQDTDVKFLLTSSQAEALREALETT
jgi:hypothetical protein